MVGGSKYAWEQIKDVWLAISATDFRNGKPLEGGSPCKPIEGVKMCSIYCENGAGHYVKDENTTGSNMEICK